MRVLTALLADYALAHDDGKLYVTGGALHTLRVPTIPFTYQRLSLAGTVSFDASECDQPHRIEVSSTGPGGDAFIKPANIWLLPRPEASGQLATIVPFVYHVAEVLLAREGSYTLMLRWDDDSYSLPALRVILDAANAARWVAANAAGYEAYRLGDLDGARQAFEQTLAEPGGEAQGHNNLGFVLLQLGRAAEALEHFEAAARVGYSAVEVLEPNVACCRYLLGEAALAFESFRRCYREGTLTSTSYLLEIQATTFRSRTLMSSSSYSRLMAVNAAWSALAARLVDEAKHWVAIAEDAEAELTDIDDSSVPMLKLRLASNDPFPRPWPPESA